MIGIDQRWPRFIAITALAVRQNPQKAVVAIGLILRGKRLRGWNRLCALVQASDSGYQAWIDWSEPALCGDRLQRNPANQAPVRCIPIVLHDLQSSAQGTQATIASLHRAFGPDVTIGVMGQPCPELPGKVRTLAAELPAALRALCADCPDAWIVPIQSGDCVAPMLGAAIGQAAFSRPIAAVIYWDEDRLAQGRRSCPWVKPGWDPLLNLSQDMLTGSCAIALKAAASVALRIAPTAADHDGFAELLSALVTDGSIAEPAHIPMILLHRAPRQRTFQEHRVGTRLARYFPDFELVGAAREGEPRLVRPRSPDHWPRVSILIPTRNRADLVRACLAGLARLDYPGECEVIVIDNESDDPALLTLLEELEMSGGGTRLAVGGAFNFARLNNVAVRHAGGEMLCLLNNDIEPLDGAWLEAMIRHACRDGVGAVGARLLYPDGTVQHAGVAVGIGGAAGHVQKGAIPGECAHSTWVDVTRSVSAVTAACMVVRRDHYLAVGGLDEAHFAVAFNDVDFCLRLQAAGLSNVYVAQATLIHHESKSRGRDDAPGNAKRFAAELATLRQRWGTMAFQDPYFSTLFSRTSERCLLAF